MDLGLKDRVALVAASSQGLGKAVALGLAREGAKLALCSRDRAAIEATAEEIRKETGVKVLAAAVDVTNEGQVREFVGQTKARFGGIDIWIANAGGPPAKGFDAITIEEWRRAIESNLMSTIFFAREVLPGMKERRWGRLITITSLTVKQPVDGLILSNSSARGRRGTGKEPVERIRGAQCPGKQCLSRLYGDGPAGGAFLYAGEIRRRDGG